MPASSDALVRPPLARAALPWLALAAALSGVLLDLASHAIAQPWAAPVFASLALSCALWVRSPAVRPIAPALGWVLAALAGVAGALLAAADAARFGRLALPLAVVGLALRTGKPSLGLALGSVWLVPLPHALLRAASPELEGAWLEVARQILGDGARALAPSLRPEDSGLALAWWLAGAGYLRATTNGARILAALRRAIASALAAFPLQVAAILAASAMATANGGSLRTAEIWLHAIAPVALPVAIWIAALAPAIVRARGGPREHR